MGSNMAAEKSAGGPQAASGMMGKVVIGAIISVVILVETVVAFMIMPDASTVRTQAEANLKKASDDKKEDADIPTDEKKGPDAELEIGSFSIMLHDGASDTTLQVTCKIYCTVSETDKADAEKLLANNKNRIRERITIQFRQSDLNDFKESDLGLLKLKILEKTNQILGKNVIKEILITDMQAQAR